MEVLYKVNEIKKLAMIPQSGVNIINRPQVLVCCIVVATDIQICSTNVN